MIFVIFFLYNFWYALYKEGGVFKKITGIIRSFARRLITILSIYKYDFVFIHREASHIGPPIFEFIIAKIFRKPYIYDFDDAIWLPNYSESNAKVHRLKAYWKVKYLVKWAGQVTVGNSYLANYAREFNNNVKIIPTTNLTPIDEQCNNLPKLFLTIFFDISLAISTGLIKFISNDFI